MTNVLDLYRSRLGEPKSKGSGKRGKELCGPCPGCGGKDRFVVWPDKGEMGEYMCRKCHCAGDAPQFLMDFDGLSYPEACKQLGVKLDPKAPSTPRLPARARETFEPRATPPPSSGLWLTKAQAFADHCHKNLLSTPKQLDWLAARGISRESAEIFRLGWNPRDEYRPREAWGLPEKLKEDGITPFKLKLHHGHTIPWFANGQIRRVRVRKWVVRKEDPNDPRYILVPNVPEGAGMDTFISRDGAQAYVVVESELDGVLVAQEAGDLVGVVALGSATTSPDARASASLAKAKIILVALDYDEAGGKAFWAPPKNSPEPHGWWRRTYPSSIRWMSPEGKDPGDYVKDHGGCVRSWVLAGLPPSMTVGLSRSGGGSSGGGGDEHPLAAKWRRFAAGNGGAIRLVRYRIGESVEVDLDWRPGTPPEATHEAALLITEMGGFDAAAALGLAVDVSPAALWQPLDG